MSHLSRHRARDLRTNMTDAERTLWRRLRMRQLGGHKFRRQYPIDNYIVDFICLEKRLIIELDGGQHVEREAYDIRRTTWLKKQGFQILRFWNHEVFKELDVVMAAIIATLDIPPSCPSPARGEGNPTDASI